MKGWKRILLMPLIFVVHTPHSVTAKTESSEVSDLGKQRLIHALRGQEKSPFDKWESTFNRYFKFLRTTKRLTAAETYEKLSALRNLILWLPQSNFSRSEMSAIAKQLEDSKKFLESKIGIARTNLGTDTESFLWTDHAITIRDQRDVFSILHEGDQERDLHDEDAPEKVAARLERVLEFVGRQGAAKETIDEKIVAFNFEQALSYFKVGYWAEKDCAVEFAQAFCRLVKYVAGLNDKTKQTLVGPSDSGLDPITRYFIPDPGSGQDASQYSVAQKLVYAHALLNAGYDRSDLINAAFDLQLDFQYPVVEKFAPAFLRLTAQKLLDKKYTLSTVFADELFKRLDNFIHPFGAHGLEGAALAIEFKVVVHDIDEITKKLLPHTVKKATSKTDESSKETPSLWSRIKHRVQKLFHALARA